jgi:hypothetical protein
MTTDPALEYARQQIENAEHGLADNQCHSCRRYRTDGRRLNPADHAGTCAYSALQPPMPPTWSYTP